MNNGEINTILAEAYYQEAVRCARAGRWDHALRLLNGMAQLAPFDPRASLLRAKVLLRLGHYQASLVALGAAKDLGHDSEENARMVSLLVRWDARRSAQRRRRIRRRHAARACGHASAALAMRLGGTMDRGARVLAAALRSSRSLLRPGRQDTTRPTAERGGERPDDAHVTPAATEAGGPGHATEPEAPPPGAPADTP